MKGKWLLFFISILFGNGIFGNISFNDSLVVADFSIENACLFESVIFTDLSQGNVETWEWDFDNGVGTSNEQDPEFIFSGVGTFQVRLIVSNFCGSDTISKIIEIQDQIPTLTDTVVCNNDPVTFNGITYQEFVPTQTVFNYFDTLTSSQGCDSISLLRLTVNPCGCELTFPNAFTPDGDGVNDTFQPYVVCDLPIKNYRMVIFDRWGETVYETFEYQDFWDGKINGFPMPTDVFVYLVQYEIIDGLDSNQFNEIKDVTLIR